MTTANKLLKEALDNQRKINEIINFINEHKDDLTEEQEDELDEIRQKMDELLPELERLDKNNPKFYLN